MCWAAVLLFSFGGHQAPVDFFPVLQSLVSRANSLCKANSLSFEYESAAEIGRTGSPRTNMHPCGPALEPESQWAEASSEGHGESEPDS